jgi:predicted transcriptional regulator
MTPQELDSVERFLAAYNALDAYFQSTLGTTSHQSFRSLVDLYAKRNAWWDDAETLRSFANLRNVLVHEHTEPYEYVCVPSPQTVERIEAIRDRLLHPETALPRFQRAVHTLDAHDTLSEALRLIHQQGYSQFPVYEGERFSGVLTENSITRWLAARMHSNTPDFGKIALAEVLRFSRKRPNFQFVGREARIEEISFQFHQNTWLEVVLVTQHGHEHEKLLGIVTRGDIWRFESGQKPG